MSTGGSLQPRPRPVVRSVRPVVWAQVTFKAVPLQEGEEGEAEVRILLHCTAVYLVYTICMSFYDVISLC